MYICYWFLSILPLMCRNVFWCCYLFIDMINIIALHEFFQPKWLQLKTQTFQCIACCVISQTERDYMYNQWCWYVIEYCHFIVLYWDQLRQTVATRCSFWTWHSSSTLQYRCSGFIASLEFFQGFYHLLLSWFLFSL